MLGDRELLYAASDAAREVFASDETLSKEENAPICAELSYIAAKNARAD